MCGGNNNNNNEASNRRTIITDEYSFESTDETTVKFVPAPAPKPVVCTCPPPQPLVCTCPPPVAKYEPPRYIPLKRCPSLTSVVTVNFPVCATEAPKTPAALRRCASIKRIDSCRQDDNNTVVTLVNLPLNPPRPSRSRASSRTRLCGGANEQENKLVRSTSITYRSNESLNDLNVKYDFEERIEETKAAPKPAECTCPPKITICKTNPCPLPVYPSICPPKPQPPCTCAPKPKECTCPPKPKECTCPPKPKECTCPPKPKEIICCPPPTKVTICTCPPPPNPCPLPVYPSICNKNASSSCLSSAKSFSNLSNIETTTTTTTSFSEDKKASCQQQGNSLTYVYNDSDNDRQVTYIRHTDNDTGLSLPGCLIKASETHLPVSRSVNLGAIFNGSSFGLLTESIFIRDSFDLSFEFRTNSRNGIMAIVVDDKTNDSFFIELYDSQIKATLFISGEADSCWTDFSSHLLSNDIWINVNVTINNNKMCLTVKNNFYTKQHRCQLRCPIRGDLFVAGHPATIEPPFVCRSKSFFVGEMRNFCVNNNGVKWYGTPSSKQVRLRNWY